MKIRSQKSSYIANFFHRFFHFNQIKEIPFIFFVLLTGIVLIGLILLYSAGGGFSPWCVRQILRFLFGFVIMLIVASAPIRIWYSYAYWLYGIALACLLLTTFIGVAEMGAQRWINIFFFQFQPAELMRISLILVLARYFNDNHIIGPFNFRLLVIPSLLVLAPVVLTLKQPDLGTAILLLSSGGLLFFFAGVHPRFFISIITMAIISLPVGWHGLHEYQKNRVLTFLDPERDPLGSGYHIIQSKIAIGSGGFWGKGFMKGTQSALNFLPEKQTDFIFTLLSEEFGFIGVILLLVLYAGFIVLNFFLSFRTKNIFCRLMISGLTSSFALYVIINIAMVVGFLPVVGIPLPLVSYGGTSLVTIMIGEGLILSAAFYKLKANQIDLFQR